MSKSPKRPVARRACLACREKKIKCDGEPLSSILSIDGSNKVIPQTTRTCSNCNLIGIECVFVQSNRGGRRKKKLQDLHDLHDLEGRKRSKSTDLIDEMNSSNSASSINSHGSYNPPYVAGTQSLDGYANGNGNGNRNGNGNNGDGHGHRNSHGNNQPHGSWHGYQQQPQIPQQPQLPHSNRYPHFQYNNPFQLPFNPSGYQRSISGHLHGPVPGHPLGIHPGHSPGPTSLPGNLPVASPASLPGSLPNHPWKVLPIRSGPPSVGPGPENYAYPPAPQSLVLSDTTSNSGNDVSGESKPRFNYDKTISSSRLKPKLPPLEKLTNNQVTLPSIKFTKSPISDDNRSSESPPKNEPGPEPLQPSTPSPAIFSDIELAKYDLPNWNTLNELIDIYYRFQHPNHQLLPSKYLFLSRLSLNLDSSILHTIILNVCLIKDEMPKGWDIIHTEEYWLSKVYKHMDSLNDLGLLVCYVLLAKASIIRFNLPLLNDINVKMWEIIKNNNYLYIYSQENFEQYTSTSRQAYERELIIRVLWSFYISNIILLRLNQGYPYYKLSLLVDEKQFDYEVSKKFCKIVIPVTNKDYYSFENINSRMEWSEARKPANINDVIVTIVSGQTLENVLNGISENNLIDDKSTSFDDEFIKYVETEYYDIKHDYRLVIIKASLFLSMFVCKTSNLLKYSYFLMDIMNFKLFKNEYIGTQENKMILPLISDVTIGNLADFDNFPKIIDQLTQEQWNQLIHLITSTFDILNLIDYNFNIPKQTPPIDSYSVVFGPCHIDQGPFADWWKNPKSHTKLTKSWTRFTEFSLVSACAALSVLASLIVLVKFIKFINNNGKLKVELLSSSTFKEFDIPLSQELVDGFTLENLQNYKSQVTSFIKVRLRCYHQQVGVNTMVKMNKISHYLEEILNNVK